MAHSNVSGPGPVSTLSSLPCQIVLFLQDDFALGVIASASRMDENWVLLVDTSKMSAIRRREKQRQGPEIAATLFMGMKFPLIAKQLSAETGQGRGKINKV